MPKKNSLCPSKTHWKSCYGQSPPSSMITQPEIFLYRAFVKSVSAYLTSSLCLLQSIEGVASERVLLLPRGNCADRTRSHFCIVLHLLSSSPRLCTAWNTTRSYLITAKPAPPMAWQGLYISSGSLTLRRNVGRFPAGSSQTSFSSFADTSNNSLCGWLMKILLV